MKPEAIEPAGATPAVVANAEIAIPVPLHQTFHYAVPPDLVDRVVPGSRVLVAFARRKVVGYVVARDTPPPDGIKLINVSAALDEGRPTFDGHLLGLLGFIAEYYRAPIGEVFRAAHPAGTNAKGAPGLEITEAGRTCGAVGATGAVLRYLAAQAEPVLVSSIDPLPKPAWIKRMAESGWVRRVQVVAAPRVEVRTERAVQAMGPPPTLPRGPGGRPLKRDEIHGWLVGRGVVPTREVRAAFPHAGGHLKKLLEEGGVAERTVEVLRDPFFGACVARDSAPSLNAGQRAAVAAIDEAEGSFGAFLLHGITGSGKTEVYLHAIEAALAKGLGTLVLVPEIALTPQLVRRFRARLGDALAVLHSGLSDGARFDQWRRLHRGEVRVAIGARSAVFAPVPNLGLIIIDEEHDPSFKQHEGVRYHARDMALLRGARQKAVVVLGSATPSLESTHNVQVGKLRRLSLTERPTGGTLPTVEMVDLRVHRPPDDDAPFLSHPLRRALGETLARGEQAILFLNRRGFSSSVQCGDCGFVLGCADCDISLTWYRKRRVLRCHYCDATHAMPPRCPECGVDKLQQFGRGTERLEAALTELFPSARLGRMDRDTITTTRKLQTLLGEMRARTIDILVGTQMVTKGHDFPGVTLVGVISADASLNFPDLRASERTFQLLTQVAGRAGRGTQPGRVLVQTFEPEAPALRALVEHDHARFAAEELPRRQMLGYAPYTYMATIRFDGRNVQQVEALAGRLSVALRRAGANTGGTQLRGPAAAPLAVIRNRIRWALLISAERRDRLQHLLAAAEAVFPEGGDLRVAVDVDPYDFM
jgi:primosomal protein N' (replication factor Y)